VKTATRRTRLWLLVTLASLVGVLVGGCGPIAATIDTQTALRDAGYQSVSVNFSVGNTDEVRVSVTVNAEPTLSDADDVAHIVWNKFHERFSLLAVTVHGSGPSVTRDYSYSDLVTMFGPRNPAYDRTSLSSATTRLGVIVIVVLVVLAAAVVLTVVMVTRRRRRRAPAWPAGGPPWMQGGQPPGGHPPGRGPWQPGGPPPPPPGGPWQPGTSPPPGPAQPPASFPMWPPPQGPPPERPAQPGSPPERAPAWPPLPAPPPGEND
jgi:hypothetical protein